MHDTRPAPYDPATIDTLLGQNWRGNLRTFAAVPGTVLQDDATIFYYLTTINENAVMWANLIDEDIVPSLDLMRIAFAAHHKHLEWLVGPDSHPANLGVRLQALGLRDIHHIPTMAADLDHLLPAPAVPAGVTFELVRNPATLAEWIATEAGGFEQQPEVARWYATLRRNVSVTSDAPMRHYLARLHGAPVATTTLFPDGKTAGIYDVATLPAARHQGIAGALVAHVLNEARTAGYHLAILQSSKLGHSVYLRLGFADCTPYIIFADPSGEGGVDQA